MEPILLSTDIGSDIDDALALLIALNHPNIDLRGVYTTNGNVIVRSFIAQELVKLVGHSVPVGCGVAQPLGAVVDPYTYFEEDLVLDHYLDEELMAVDPSRTYLKSLEEMGVITDGIAHMAEQLMSKPHAVFSIAPLTNIAVLIKKYPDAARNISRLYIMGFRTDRHLEHNIRFDPVAATTVLESGIPLTVIPGNVCSRFRLKFTPAYRLSSPGGAYVTSMLRAFAGAKIITDCRRTGFSEMLAHSTMNNGIVNQIGSTRYNELCRFKHVLLVNFNEQTAYLDRDDFLEKLQRLAAQLDDPELDYDRGPLWARLLRSLLVQEISVADTYIPFCFLHRDKLKIEECELGCTMEGMTQLVRGGRHQVVTDLDFTLFERFLNQYLW